jgi:hypothetical protein
MAIEALYPSRCQSQRHNPLFARERRRKKIIAIAAFGAGLFCFVRIPPPPAQASTVSLHAVAQAVPAAPKRKVRIIPLYNIPSNQELGKA